MKQLIISLLIMAVLLFSCGKENSLKPDSVAQVQTDIDEGLDVLGRYGLDYSSSDQEDFHEKAFALYKEGNYYESALIYKKAVKKFPGFAKGHYNLACMHALMKADGMYSDEKKILEHLSSAFMLDPAYKELAGSDSDLDSIRETAAFMELLQDINDTEGRLYLAGNTVTLILPDREIPIIELGQEEGYSDEWPDFLHYLGPTAVFSNNEKYLLCIARGPEEWDLYLVSSYGRKKNITQSGGMRAYNNAYTIDIAWSGDDSRFCFVWNEEIWGYDMARGELTQLTFLKEDPDIRESPSAPEFVDNNTIRFMLGSIFEYHYSGREYELKRHSGEINEVPGGKYIPPEDLRGGE